MNTRSAVFTAILTVSTFCHAADLDFWKEPTDLPFDVSILETQEDSNICWQAMVYTSEMYKEQPMRIFAWYAWPKSEGKHPAVLSIHGGGGGADLPRAQEFARAGFACLSYDWNAWREGGKKWNPGDPLPATSNTVYCGLWYDEWTQQFCYPGPSNDWKWCTLYRSLIAARRGLTWMTQRPEVDADKLFAEGHSWGGFQGQTFAGIEPRLKAVAVSASAGSWETRYKIGQEGHTKNLKPEQAAEFFNHYDPVSFVDNIKAPILIRLGVADFFASVDNLMEYWDRIKSPKSLELLPAGNHTFADVTARAAWFKQWLKTGPEFPTITSVNVEPGHKDSWTVELQTAGPAPIQKALIAWTTSTNDWWNKRGWLVQPLTTNAAGAWQGSFSPVRTGGPFRYFVSAKDANGRVVSSLPIVKELPAAKEIPSPVLHQNFTVAQARKSPFAKAKEWKRANIVEPIANGPEMVGGQSAALSTLWDKDMLYIQAVIADTTPWTLASPKADPHSGDGLHFHIATVPPTNATTPAATSIVLRISMNPDADGKTKIKVTRGKDEITDLSSLLSATEATPASTTISMGIPWTLWAADLKPASGDILDLRASFYFGDHLIGERTGNIEFNRFNPDDKNAVKNKVVLE